MHVYDIQVAMKSICLPRSPFIKLRTPVSGSSPQQTARTAGPLERTTSKQAVDTYVFMKMSKMAAIKCLQSGLLALLIDAFSVVSGGTDRRDLCTAATRSLRLNRA